MRRSIEKSRIQIEEGRDWCCQKTGMNGRNMARSSSKILGKSGAILNARTETAWQRRELSGPALIIFE
ncbi:hypothetical protein OIU74_013829 [Salix koriyanagi]|uniref:Uncharacterized protein n=1 Tax=Salix koriyanagi TaxID=2511006 RepID=A0A9Q0SZ91_9ROSI|nr:hypothetical protein OIU74_013829 [Salix koriyanagi]